MLDVFLLCMAILSILSALYASHRIDRLLLRIEELEKDQASIAKDLLVLAEQDVTQGELLVAITNAAYGRALMEKPQGILLVPGPRTPQ